MNDVDVGLFEFDFDLTWTGFFLSAENRIYSRYGGRDAKNEEGRVSVAGLKTTMRRVLKLHEAATPAQRQPSTPQRVLRAADVFKVREKECLHCHQVWEGLRERERTAGTFDPAMLFVYPLPENIGIEVDVDQGNRIVKVRSDSAAARAGLQPGDDVVRIGSTAILSQADIMFALHQTAGEGPLTVEVQRAGEQITAQLQLTKGWRRTDLSWRQSIIPELKYLKKLE